MVDQKRVRPVSGEIMTDARPERSGAHRPAGAMDDIVDAEYESVAFARIADTAAPRVEPLVEPAPRARAGMDVLRGDGGSAAAGPRRAGPLFWIGGVVVALAAFWVSGGHVLGQVLFEPVRGGASASIRLLDVRSHVEEHQGRRFVYVDGSVANEGATATEAPPLAIEVRGDDNSTTRYILHVSGTRIEPGERVAFSSRLDAPEGGVAGVMVTIKREGGA